MKTTKLFFAVILISAFMFTSCGEEVTTTEETVNTFQFAKTSEMLDFEASLKTWFQAKRETQNGQMSAKTNINLEKKVTQDAQNLLVSIGANDLSKKTNQSTDEIIRVTMKAYSKKLTEMYKNSNK